MMPPFLFKTIIYYDFAKYTLFFRFSILFYLQSFIAIYNLLDWNNEFVYYMCKAKVFILID